MSQADWTLTEVEVVVDAEDPAWLEERLVEYRQLLAYLRDH